jgi:hypothetical protein
VTDSWLSPTDVPDPDDKLLGLDPYDGRAVLGPHTALSRREVADRYELLRREREGRP